MVNDLPWQPLLPFLNTQAGAKTFSPDFAVFTLKGQMEDEMLVSGQGRTDIGNPTGLPGSERELCVQLMRLVTG